MRDILSYIIDKRAAVRHEYELIFLQKDELISNLRERRNAMFDD